MTKMLSGTLIVGGDSMIGKALRDYCTVSKQPVYWTTRRPVQTPGVDHLELDLARLREDWFPPANVSSAVLCAAVTRIDACRKDPAATARINIDGAVDVARRLIERGVFTIFLSTNQVFDGQRAFAAPDDPTSPCSAYGCQKAEAERRLLELGPLVAVVRCTKILGPEFPLFRQWLTTLRNRQPVEAFSDMCMAPMPLSYPVAVIRLLMERRTGGIFHLSGNRDLPYVDIARRAAAQLAVSEELVRPISGVTSGRILEPIPIYTTLNVEKVRSLLGVDAPPVEWTIDRALAAA